MNKRTVGIWALVLLIAGAWWSIIGTLWPGRVDTGLFSALGEAAAKECAARIRKSGRVVVVDAELGEFKLLAPIQTATVKGFKRSIGKAGLNIEAVERVPIAAPTMSRDGVFMRPGELDAVIARHPNVDALVLFVGLAGPPESGGSKGGKPRPKLFVVSNYDRVYKTLLQQERLDLVIVANPDDPPSEPSVTDSAGWFQRHYLVATPESFSKLPE